ncbi:MAG: type II secretion system F family protein, partial [Hyphomicrobiaceae bacterium]
MASIDASQALFLLLAAITVASIAYVLMFPYMSGERQAQKRLNSVAENRAGRQARKAQAETTNARRKAVAETLKDLEDKQKEKQKVPLKLRLQRAGLDISPNVFWIASCLTGGSLGLLLLIMMPSIPPVAIGVVVFIGAFGLPRWFVSKMTSRRQAKFLDEFANAVDVIVRGVKSGLPLNECLTIIARESPSPLREEFQELIEQQRVGIPLADCFERMMSRVPLPEVKFFAIVIGIQQQAGGNLSEALGNLAGVLRDRKQLAAKVQA